MYAISHINVPDGGLCGTFGVIFLALFSFNPFKCVICDSDKLKGCRFSTKLFIGISSMFLAFLMLINNESKTSKLQPETAGHDFVIAGARKHAGLK